MSNPDPSNYALPNELRLIADICEKLETVLPPIGSDISLGDVEIFDANGESLGKIGVTQGGNWGYMPWDASN